MIGMLVVIVGVSGVVADVHEPEYETALVEGRAVVEPLPEARGNVARMNSIE